MVSHNEKNQPKILVADDEDLFLQSTADILREEGYDCDTVTNGEEGFQALKNARYNLLIADINMPGNTGLEFVRRGRLCFPELAIMLVTGYPEIDTAVGGIEINVTNYLLKPLDTKTLIDKVADAVSRSKVGRERETPQTPLLAPEMPKPFYRRVLDEDGRVHMISPEFAYLLGYGPAEVSHRQMVDLAETPLFPSATSDSPEAERIVEQTFSKRNGEVLETLVIRRPLPMGPGNDRLTEEYIIDLTDLKHGRGGGSFGHLFETAGLIAGGIAHDLNNMLGIVDGYLLLCQDWIDSRHQTQEYLKESRLAVKRATHLTEELLEFSKSEQHTDFEKFELVPIVEELESLSKVRLGDNVEFIVSRPEVVPGILGNPNTLFDALFNLVLNSADAMSSSGGVIHLHIDFLPNVCKPKPSNDTKNMDGASSTRDYVTIEVLDNGSGIPANLIEKVHQPFFSTKRSTGGNGLGLAIVFRTVERMGGFVDIHSVQGLGTGVKLWIPCAGSEC